MSDCAYSPILGQAPLLSSRSGQLGEWAKGRNGPDLDQTGQMGRNGPNGVRCERIAARCGIPAQDFENVPLCFYGVHSILVVVVVVVVLSLVASQCGKRRPDSDWWSAKKEGRRFEEDGWQMAGRQAASHHERPARQQSNTSPPPSTRDEPRPFHRLHLFPSKRHIVQWDRGSGR